MKTKNEKLLSGTYRPDRDNPQRFKLNKTTLIESLPDPLGELSESERELWVKYCEIKIDNNTLTAADLPEIETLCRLITKRSDLFDSIQKSGLVLTFKTGHRQVSPELSIIEKLDRLINAKLRLLGLDTVNLKKVDAINAKIDYNPESQAKRNQIDELLKNLQ